MYYTVGDTANQSVTYKAEVWIVSVDDGKEHLHSSKTMDFMKAWDILGSESIFLSFIFVGTLVFIGLTAGPVASIMMCVLGLLLSFYLGWLMIGLESIVGLAISGFIVAFRRKYR